MIGQVQNTRRMGRFLHNYPSRSELTWALLISMVVCFLANVPYLTGYLLSSSDSRFAGVVVAPEDQLSYFAKMRQGQQGAWTFHLPYTSQSHEGKPIYLYFLFWGHISRWTGLSIFLIYHINRIINDILLLIISFIAICQWTDDFLERRFSFMLLVGSSGLGWMMAFLGKLLSTDLTVPESNTFYTLMGPPHVALSQALILLVFLSYLSPDETISGNVTLITVICLSLILLALIQPFLVSNVFGTAGIYISAIRIREGRWPRLLMLRAGISVPLIILLICFTYFSLQSDPMLHAWMSQNINLSPKVWYYLSGYGLLLVALPFGIVASVRRRHRADLLLLSWLLTTILGLYAPISLQRRLSSGLHLAVAFLAGIGICRFGLLRLLLSRKFYHIFFFILIFSLTNIFLIMLFTIGVISHNSKLFIQSSEIQAFHWLQKYAREDSVVLSSTSLGAFIPAFTNMRAVSGHGFETVNATYVEAQVRYFYSDEITLEQRSQLLELWDVSYVIWGQRERQIEKAEPQEHPMLTKVAEFNDLVIFQVIKKASSQ